MLPRMEETELECSCDQANRCPPLNFPSSYVMPAVDGAQGKQASDSGCGASAGCRKASRHPGAAPASGAPLLLHIGVCLNDVTRPVLGP